MKITRRSLLTGVVRTKDMDVTEDQLRLFMVDGHMIQDVFPHLSPDDREFILSGSTAEEWDAAFPEVDGPDLNEDGPGNDFDEDYVPDPGDHDGQPDEAQEWHDFDPDC